MAVPRSPRGLIAGKRALVTGGASGIGRAVCGRQGRRDLGAAQECGPEIRVNCVSPGVIRTPMIEPLFAAPGLLDPVLRRVLPHVKLDDPGAG